MIVRKAAREIAKRLYPVAGEDAELEASFLLRALGFHSPYQTVSETDAEAIEPLIERRRAGEPLQYVLGEWEFYGLPFYVDRTVLIPRPDTERIVEIGERFLSDERRDVLDLCCGSGCIGIALAVRCDAAVTAADISADALALTERNARRNGVTVKTVQSDFLDSVEGTFDLIVCNPPYLSREEMDARDASLRYEPEEALYGGEDGLMFYRRLKAQYRGFLKPGGLLLIEIGMNRKDAVEAMFPNAECFTDYGGRPRVIAVRNDD